MYYYLDENKLQHGPIAKENLVSYGVKADTLVWKAGMAEWQKAKDVPDLSALFDVPPSAPQFTQQPAYGQQQAPYGQQQAPYGQQQQSGYGQPYGVYGNGNGYQQAPYGQQQRRPAPAKPENYLVWSILATLCCCLPAGIVGIIYSSQVDSHYNNGRYRQARDASDKAKTWCIVSLVLGLLSSGIALLINLADM